MDTSVAKMGTVDLLQGLLATVTLKLAEEQRGKPVHIPVGELTNILHELQRQEEFEQDLRYLDFDEIGGSSYSVALENFLFQAGTWRQYKVPNPALPTISIDVPRAKRQLEAIKTDYHEEGLSRIDALAEEYMRIRSDAQTNT